MLLSTASNAPLANYLESEVFLKAMTVFAFELYLFMDAGQLVSFTNVLSLVQIEPFDLWRTFEFFVRTFRRMPKRVREYFNEMERFIIQTLCWQEGSSVVQKCKNLTDGREAPDKINKPYEAFFKRLLHFAAIRVSEITLEINICDEVRELIWGLLQVCLSKESHMLENRNLDQIVICTIYSMCRIHHATLKMNPKFNIPIEELFKTITNAYAVVNEKQNISVGKRFDAFHTNSFQVLAQVNLGNGEVGDVITFYNVVYLVTMKNYALATRKLATKQRECQTPLLHRSSYESLLTPSGAKEKKGIDNLAPFSNLAAEEQKLRSEQADEQTFIVKKKGVLPSKPKALAN